MEGSKKYWDVKRPSHFKRYQNNQDYFEYHTLRPGQCDICKRINAKVQEKEVKETVQIKVTVN